MRRLVLLVGIATASVAMPDPATRASGAPDEHRAVVVVDTGEGEPKRACVVFTEPSITGLDALRAARMDPVVQTYSGQGGAVCALCGVGCSAGSSCLTCKAPKYWQYWRAVGGARSYSYSNAGAGSTSVRDGDVEGWNWGEQKTAPPYYSVDVVCSDPSRTFRFEASSDESPPATTTTAPASTTTSSAPDAPAAPRQHAATTLPASTPAASAAGPVTTTAAGSAATEEAEGAATSTTQEPGYDGEPSREAETAAAPASQDGGGGPRQAEGSSPAAVAAFLVLLGAVVGLTVRSRVRSRHRPTP